MKSTALIPVFAALLTIPLVAQETLAPPAAVEVTPSTPATTAVAEEAERSLETTADPMPVEQPEPQPQPTGSTGPTGAENETSAETPKPGTETEPGQPVEPDPAIDDLAGVPLAERPEVTSRSHEEIQAELARLQAEAQLREARLGAQLAEARAELTALQTERDATTTQLELQAARRNAEREEEVARLSAERDAALLLAATAEARAKEVQMNHSVAELERTAGTDEIDDTMNRLETERQAALVASSDPVYLDQPLREDGTLVISDRRIPLNGPIVQDTASFVASRIQFYNNQDPAKPIFIVIDNSPGGSVAAGYQILNAVESSEAPIHVIVKGSAASMAAVIATLADHSYTLPNATLLHHQISWFQGGNLSQQRESMENARQWWVRLAGPVAEKMGIELDAFIELMYENAVDGDWIEFGDKAVELAWVDHIALRVEETAQLEHPSISDSDEDQPPTHGGISGLPMTSIRAAFQDQPAARLPEEIDDSGNRFVRLPRAEPADRYYLYNPDGYYRY